MSRLSLFWRLFAVYTAVGAVAVAVLVLAPVSVSVPTAPREVVVLLVGFVIALVVYLVVLRRVLAPLERLTRVMQRVDPLAPGRRLAARGGDAEVMALTNAFNEMLDRLEAERRDSAVRAVAAEEAERRRIARELHDEIGQTLTGLALRSDAIARRVPSDLRDELEEMRETARQGAEGVRMIARRLRPEVLDELGLRSALMALSSAILDPAGLVADRSLEDGLMLSAEQELVVYRVAQEGLNNVVRHAGASRVELRLRAAEHGVLLIVRDDGMGLHIDAATETTGIRGMRERALLVHGELALRGVQPHGTELRLWLPSRGHR